MSSLLSHGLAALAIVLCTAAFASAQPASGNSGDGAELAKKLSNPISDLVSVPFQFNWEQNVGPKEQTRFILNVQPVMPFSLTAKINLITRVIVPFVSQPALSEGGLPASGVGDILASFFFSPNTGGTFTWGVGPVISLPSTAEPTLGTEKWSAGPTIVALKQAGPWTVGALWNQVWSFAGNIDRPGVNQMFVQPFLAYTTTTAVTITVQSETVANFRLTPRSGPFRSTSCCRRSRRLERSRPAIRLASAAIRCIPMRGHPGRCAARLCCSCRGNTDASDLESSSSRHACWLGLRWLTEYRSSFTTS